MSPKGSPGDLDHAIKLYVAGEGIDVAGEAAGVGERRLKTALRERDLLRTNAEARALADAKRRARIDALADQIVPRYLAGESTAELMVEFGIGNRNAIKRLVEESGHWWRGRPGSMKTRMARMTFAERQANAAAANEAARGRVHSLEERIQRAQTVETRQLHVAPAERLLGCWLKKRGIESIPQKAIGPYNADLGAAPVAVEIFGGSWHNTGRHAARTPDRARYILNEGWNLVIVWNDRRLAPFDTGCADYIAAFHERSRRDPTFRGEYRVIWSDGKEASPASPDLDNLALKPSRSGRKRRRS